MSTFLTLPTRKRPTRLGRHTLAQTMVGKPAHYTKFVKV